MVELLIFVLSGIFILFLFYTTVVVIDKITEFIKEKIIQKRIKRQTQKEIDEIIKMEEGVNYCIEECPICMEQKNVCEQKCHHRICKDCWVEIIERYNICPICRIPVKIRDLKYLKT